MVNYLDTGRLPSWFEGGWSPSCNSQCQSSLIIVNSRHPAIVYFSLLNVVQFSNVSRWQLSHLVGVLQCLWEVKCARWSIRALASLWSNVKLFDRHVKIGEHAPIQKVSPARSWVSPAESWHRCRRRRSPSGCARCWSGWTSARSPTPTRLSSLSAWPAWNRSLILASFYSCGD